ncbi:MAG: XRE family transcriptional regulator [Pacificimonas sp.]|jgi:uncharacterized protein (DUF2384 family)|nr:XRE family transcriptional regulator [Pacificimonas sp.]
MTMTAFKPAPFLGPQGFVDVDSVTNTLRMSTHQLADTAGLPRTTVAKRDRRQGAKAQARLLEMLHILARIDQWAGGYAQALSWYRAEPIPALDGRTAEALVKDGRAGDVLDYLDHLAVGGYA